MADPWPTELRLDKDKRVLTVTFDDGQSYALPAELLRLIATPSERLRIGDDPYGGRLLFVVKEAVYKAVHPLDRTFLEHHDVEVSLADRTATVRNGRVVELRYCVSSHLVALAFVPGGR